MTSYDPNDYSPGVPVWPGVPGYVDMDDYAPMATMSDAHAEWHRNAGVPMGQPGCPQDACHPDDGEPMSVELDCQRFGHEVYDGKCTYCGAPCCAECGVLPGEPHDVGCVNR